MVSGMSRHQNLCKKKGKLWSDDHLASIAALDCPPPVISSTTALDDTIAGYKRQLHRELDGKLFSDLPSPPPAGGAAGMSSPPAQASAPADLPGEPPLEAARLDWRPREDAPSARELAQQGTHATLDKVLLALRASYIAACRPFLARFTAAAANEDVNGQIAAYAQHTSFQQ